MAFKIIVLSCLLAFASAGPHLGLRVPNLKPTLGLRIDELIGSRVVGGEDAKKGEFPHQVSLQWGPTASRAEHFCGGSIIAPNWVLTAGHCVLAIPSYGAFVVKAGKHNIDNKESGEQAIEVEESFVHDKYPGNVAPNDIALLKLKESFKLNSAVVQIALPKKNVEPEGDVIISGWGSISKSQFPIYPSILQKAVLPIVDRKTCNNAILQLSDESPLDETNICTGPLSGGRGACSGDSGGPLISSNGKTQVGIVSWGFIPCGSRGAPSVFVKVAHFIDWIHDTVSANA